MKQIKNLLLVALFVAVFSSVASEENLQKALEAFADGDYVTVLDIASPLAEEGNAKAQNIMGWLYEFGLAVDQSYEEALKWYFLAAEAGHALAQHNLGFMYDEGRGVEQNYKEAEKWYRLAAEAGWPPSQNNLGHMYELGLGVIQSKHLGYMWYTFAAEQGVELAKENRDILAKSMTPSQITEAEELAKKCLAQNYKNCEQLLTK